MARIAEPWRSRDHRRSGQGAVQLFADRRCRGCESPLGRRAPDDGEERLHQLGNGRRGEPANVRIQATTNQNSVRYFTDWALPQLDTLIDETTDPIDVWTTLDPGMQVAADRAISANAPDGAQGALVALDRDGAVRAMVGGRDYVSSIYNRATQAERQPGSAFKLFVYLAALESGMKPTDTIVDEPVTIDGWSPRNSTRTNLGPVTLREAFSRSINTVSAKIGAQVGFSAIADMARRFGITTPISTFPGYQRAHLTRLLGEIDAGRGAQLSPHENVVTHAEVWRQAHLLMDDRDPAIPRLRGGGEGDATAVELDEPGCRRHHAGQNIHQRRLAGAILS